MTTKDYDKALELIFQSLRQAGGYMVEQDDTRNDQHRSSKIVMRIPSQHFFTWIEGVEQIPNSKFSKNISTEDISEEYVDLAAHHEAKQLVNDKYKEYIQMATTADALIRYTNEMAEIQEEIDAIQARLRYLQNRVMYSTITITVTDDARISFIKELELRERFSAAWKNGIDGLVYVVTGGIFLAITLLSVAIVAGLVHIIVFRIVRMKKQSTIKRGFPELKDDSYRISNIFNYGNPYSLVTRLAMGKGRSASRRIPSPLPPLQQSFQCQYKAKKG